MDKQHLKKALHKYGLLAALLGLGIGLVGTLLFPNQLLLQFCLGLGVLCTLYFFKSTHLKIK